MLPEGWHRSTLGEIARITSGGTPDRSEPSYWGGSVPWVTTGEIQFNTITDTAEKITEAGLKNSSAKLFPPGTLLMAMYGQGKTRGQVAKLDIEASTNQACAAILLHDGHDPDFYFHYLSAQYEALRELGNAGTQQNLSGGILKEVDVFVPPIDEQRQVAQVLGTWDMAVRVAKRQVDAARSHLDALAKVVLMGHRRLTHVANVGRLQTPYGSIPADWQYARIGEVAIEVSRRPLPQDVFPVLSCTKHDGLVDSLSYFKKRVFSEDTSNYRVAPRGSFVYATNHIEEGSIGYQNLYDFGLVSPIYTVFRTEDSICDGYLYALLKTEHYRQIFASSTNASVDRRGSLRWKDFRALRVPVPPIAEQRAIARLLLDARRECDLLQAHLGALQREKSALMADLLTGRRRVRLPAAETTP
jgi:type I restriction enzyme, S subunit